MIKFMEWVLSLVGVQVSGPVSASEERIARMIESKSDRQLRREWTGR